MAAQMETEGILSTPEGISNQHSALSLAGLTHCWTKGEGKRSEGNWLRHDWREDKAQRLHWDTAEDRPGKPKLLQHTGGGFTNSPILAQIHSWNTHVRSYWNAESFNKGKLWPSWISHTKFWRKSLQIRNFSRCEISQFERWQLSYLFFRGQIIKRFEDILNLLKKIHKKLKNTVWPD